MINWLMSFINRIMPRWRALALPERSKWLLGLDTTQGYAQDCISILWHIMVPVESHETHCDANHRSKQIDLSKKSQDLKTNFYGTVASPTCILCVLNKQTCDQCRNRQMEKWNPRHGPMSSAINTPNWICRMGMGWLGCPKRTIARELAINPSAPLRKRLRPKTETPAIKQNPSLEPHMFSMGSAQRRWPNDAHTSEVALQT